MANNIKLNSGCTTGLSATGDIALGTTSWGAKSINRPVVKFCVGEEISFVVWPSGDMIRGSIIQNALCADEGAIGHNKCWFVREQISGLIRMVHPVDMTHIDPLTLLAEQAESTYENT